MRISYFRQWYLHEIALVDERMWYHKVRLGDADVVVVEDIDVNYAVVIIARRRFLRPAHHSLYLPGDAEQLSWRERCIDKHGGIDKLMLALKSPRLCLYERRASHHTAHHLTYQADGIVQIAAAIAEVGA